MVVWLASWLATYSHARVCKFINRATWANGMPSNSIFAWAENITTFNQMNVCEWKCNTKGLSIVIRVRFSFCWLSIEIKLQFYLSFESWDKPIGGKWSVRLWLWSLLFHFDLLLFCCFWIKWKSNWMSMDVLIPCFYAQIEATFTCICKVGKRKTARRFCMHWKPH